MSDNLTPLCNVGRTIVVDNSCGCTLTRAKFGGLTPQVLAGFDDTEIDLARVILNHAEASILGVPESGFDMFLMGSLTNIKPAVSTVKIGEQSVVLPYIQRPQPNIINANYFNVESGTATPNAGSGDIPASAWNIVVNNGQSPWRTNLPALERFFLKGSTVFIHNWNTVSNKVAQTLQFTVLNSVNSDSGGVNKATITLVPPFTAAGWTALDSEEKEAWQPSFGLLLPGANSVSDYESWCENEPVNLGKRLIVNYLQTSRDSICVSAAYREAIEAIMGGKINEYQRKLKQLPLVDQNRQRKAQSRRRWVNSILWGQAINENQKADGSGYTDLPTVNDPDPANPDCLLEYKANAEGLYTQLNRCQRVHDWQGQPIDLDMLFQSLYEVKRNRENTGSSIERIDCITNRYMAETFRRVMPKWYKEKYGVSNERTFMSREKIKFDGFLLFNFEIYDIPEYGFQLCITHDNAFEDITRVTPNIVGGEPGFSNRMNMMWFVDFSDWKVGVAGSKSVVRRNPSAEHQALYHCVMDVNVKEQQLNSTKWTTMVDVPERHLIYTNFSTNCPFVTAASCPVPNVYEG